MYNGIRMTILYSVLFSHAVFRYSLLQIMLIRVAISALGLLLYTSSRGTLIYLNSSTSNSSFAMVDLQTRKLKVGLV